MALPSAQSINSFCRVPKATVRCHTSKHFCTATCTIAGAHSPQRSEQTAARLRTRLLHAVRVEIRDHEGPLRAAAERQQLCERVLHHVASPHLHVGSASCMRAPRHGRAAPRVEYVQLKSGTCMWQSERDIVCTQIREANVHRSAKSRAPASAHVRARFIAETTTLYAAGAAPRSLQRSARARLARRPAASPPYRAPAASGRARHGCRKGSQRVRPAANL
jgi:hypothetical protein